MSADIMHFNFIFFIPCLNNIQRYLLGGGGVDKW